MAMILLGTPRKRPLERSEGKRRFRLWPVPCLRGMRFAGLVMACFGAALFLLPTSAQGAGPFDSVEIVGDLEALVKSGKEFKIAINPRTGKTAVFPVTQFHDDYARL